MLFMHKNPIDYLRHIKDECEFILNSIPENYTKDDFLNDEIRKRALSRSLEIIGEATKKIPADIKLKWNSIEWKNMAGMRDRLIHDYVGVNYSIVWNVAKQNIPRLLSQIINIINNELKQIQN